MNIIITLALLFIHFVADFMLQTDKQAINKSKSWHYLIEHTITYSTVFVIIGSIYGIFVNNFFLGFEFGLITFICHTITDYFTSRWSSKLWFEADRHNFFVVIGFDQFLHYLQLILTYKLLV